MGSDWTPVNYRQYRAAMRKKASDPNFSFIDPENDKWTKRWVGKQNRAERFKGIPFVEWGAAAGQIVDDVITAAGGGFDYLSPQESKNIGMSGAARAINAIGEILPGNDIFSLFVKKKDDFAISDATLKASPSYGGAFKNMKNAEAVAGKRLLAGHKAANAALDLGKRENDILSTMSLDNKRTEFNYAGQLLGTNYAIDNQGYTPGLTFFNKKGGTIPELDEVRTIMQSLQSKKQEIQEPQKFQLGGKMNMIVTGALHARKHNLEELNPNLEGEITKKGIPVVIMNEGGEVQSQQAEVETGEIIMQIDATKTIEDYYDEYNSTNSKTEKNKIALECGKYLVEELLKNTDDPDKLIKKTV